MQTITDVTSKGHGVTRLDSGQVCFVPGAWLDECVDVIEMVDKGDFAIASDWTLVEPSQNRIEARCEFFGSCGGCQWQFVTPDNQRVIKVARIQRHLESLGISTELLSPILYSSDWAYRQRVTVQSTTDGWGFIDRSENQPTPVANCLVAKPELFGTWDKLPDNLKLAWLKLCNRMEWRIDELGAIDWHCFVQSGNPPQPLIDQTLANGVSGIRINDQFWGQRDGTFMSGQRPLRAAIGVFTQIHNEINAQMIKILSDVVIDKQPNQVLDIFCGNGNLSLGALPPTVQIFGLDGDPMAIADANHNAIDHQNSKFSVVKHQTMAADIQKWHGDMIIADPPRAGLKGLCNHLSQTPASSLVYVSCQPETWRRDAKELLKAGWNLSRIQPLDMFPQTTHVELISIFER